MDDEAQAAFGYAAAMGSVLEGLIEVLAIRGIIPAWLLIEVVDQAMLAVEEEGRLSPATKAAQHAALKSLLERLRSHPAFVSPP